MTPARTRIAILLACGTLAFAGCTLFTDRETDYLKSAEGRAGREEIQRHLGKPAFVAAAATGEPIWVYHIRTAEQGGNTSYATAGYWCEEYVLQFDRQGTLTRWTKKAQKHRDDRDQPDVCVRDGFK